ncbi:MAG: Uma2 family endonuclease [Microcoleaceae cyanobacterium]
MSITKHRADRVLLQNISWQQFENLLLDLGESRSARIAYDCGTLEIITPLPEHEYYKEVIGIVIQDIAEELDINYESYGSTTWRQEAGQVGIESDNCFYIQNESKIRGKLRLDLTVDPPPDLALEIDLTSKSLNRFPIYARLGVPEIWCYDTGHLKIYQLEQNRYTEAKNSLIFPQLPIQELPGIIENNRLNGRRAIRQAVRNWINLNNNKK